MNGSDVQWFFTLEDEQKFSSALAALFPEVVFVGCLHEFKSVPALHESLDLCAANMVEIWDRAIYPNWPRMPAQRGEVLEFDTLVVHRSRRTNYNAPSGEQHEVLVSGSLSWGGGDPRVRGREDMREFAQAAMAVATSMHTGILVPLGHRLDQVPSRGVSGYIVGPAAARWCAGGASRDLKVSAGRHLYTVS